MNGQTGPAAAVEDLRVTYGRAVALDGISLEIPRGSVFALLGRNGAGKSSLVRCLVGLQKPRSGRVQLLGEDSWSRRAVLMNRVGVVPEDADAPPDMTARQIARFCSKLYPRWDGASVDTRLARFKVPQATPFRKMSKGQKKQVSLALALAPHPELLILDDPSLGLDAVARHEFYDELIGTLADEGITVILTTHDLAAIETIADRVAILRGGSVALEEDVETLKARFRRLRFAAASAPSELQKLSAVGVRAWGRGVEAVVSRFDEEALVALARNQEIRELEVSSMSLEEIFLAVSAEGEKA